MQKEAAPMAGAGVPQQQFSTDAPLPPQYWAAVAAPDAGPPGGPVASSAPAEGQPAIELSSVPVKFP